MTPVFLIILVDLLALTLIVPLLPFYAQRFGADAVTVGLLASSFALCQLVASPLLGRLSDRYGRKRILLLSQAGTFAGLLLMVGAKSLWVLFLSRMIDGFTAGNLPLAQAYIADRTDAADRAKQFGLVGVAFGIGLVLGPALSGFLSQYSWSYPIYAAAALSLASIAATAMLLPADTPSAAPSTAGSGWRDLVAYFRRPELRPWLIGFFLFVFAFGWFAGGLALFAQAKFTTKGKAYGPKEVGYLLAYCGCLGILIQGKGIGPLVKKYGEEKVVAGAFALDALGYVWLAFANGFFGLGIAATLFSIGNSCLRPALTSLVSRNSRSDEQGAVLGLTGSLQSVGQIAGPPLGNWFIERGVLGIWGMALSAICLVGLTLPRRPKSAVQ